MRSAAEKLRPLLRYGEPVATGLVALWSGWHAATLLLTGGSLPASLMMLALFVGTGLWSAASLVRLRVRAEGGSAAPGIVEAHEGRIAYLGPEEGGVVALDLLVEVSYRPAMPGAWPALWVLESADGVRLTIPAAAEGAERLPDHLGALAGFDTVTALAAIRRPGSASRSLWRRPSRHGRRIGPHT